MGVLFAMLLLCFWPTLIELPGSWNRSYQEHGFFVAGLTAWLVWRDRHRILGGSDNGIPDLLPVVVITSMVWMLAAIMSIGMIQQVLLVLVLVGWAFTVFGWEARRTILSIGVTFLLAVPFWGFLAPLLQRATTVASGGATQLAGISAVIGYDYIQITSGTFLVEEGCAGLNYLMGGLVLGAFYAHLFVARWQTQLKIVAVAGAMSIVGNWIRVAFLIFLGEATAMQSPMIEDHLWQGWVIFTLLMIPTYFMAREIETRDAATFSVEAEGAEELVVPEPPAFDPLRARRATVAALAAASGPLLFMLVGAIPRGAELDRDPAPLGVVEEWTVTDRASGEDEWTPSFTGIDDQAMWTLEHEGARVTAARHYFLDQKSGEELIQYNNAVAPDSLVASDRLIGPVGPQRRFVHEALLRGAAAPRVVWYWYRVAGFDTPFESKAKLLEILAFFRRSPAAELVTLTAVCDPDDCRDAADAIRSATGVPALPPAEDAEEVENSAEPGDDLPS